MALKMTNHEVDGASVLALDGRVVFGTEGDALREELQKLVAQGKKRIVLNMNNIESIDSARLGASVAAHLSAKIQRRFALALPPGNHKAVDGILRLQHGSSRRRQRPCLKNSQKMRRLRQVRSTISRFR